MGIDDPEIHERLHLDVLKWPKNTLAVFYLLTILWSGYAVYFGETYQDEYYIRLIYMVIMAPLSGFIVTNHKWAMTYGATVYVCFILSSLFLNIDLNPFAFYFAIFVSALTFRAFKVADIIRDSEAVGSPEKFG